MEKIQTKFGNKRKLKKNFNNMSRKTRLHFKSVFEFQTEADTVLYMTPPPMTVCRLPTHFTTLSEVFIKRDKSLSAYQVDKFLTDEVILLQIKRFYTLLLVILPVVDFYRP